MGGVLRFTESFFWTLVWVFIALIVGFYLLGLAKNQDGLIGNVAGWISGHAEPQA